MACRPIEDLIMTNEDDAVLNWDDLDPADQVRAQKLLQEFNKLFKKYEQLEKEDKSCEDSTLSELKTFPEYPVPGE